MKTLTRALLAGWLFLSFSGQAACGWPAWEQFKKEYISDQGRVIDPSDERKITTSEGQSYALFFALAANDQKAFAQLLQWTQNNLAQGSLKNNLPAWLWGRKGQNTWAVLDSNSASDADMWIVWSLLEAGRLWKNPEYMRLGQQLLRRVAKEEVANIPGLGYMLLPGKVGFNHEPRWRLNPSYLPQLVLSRVARYSGPWVSMRDTNQRLLLETSPKGFAPDWVDWVAEKGWEFKGKTTLTGSYDAIRVYLWAGMMADNDPYKAQLLERWKPMAEITEQSGLPPENVAIETGESHGDGPVGFSTALLPFLQSDKAREMQRQRMKQNPLRQGEYYNTVLTLFGQGWDQRHFRFNAQGELIPSWGKACANSH